MSKIGLVIQREYTAKVRNKTFILLTFLTPLIFIAMIAIPLWLSTFKSSDVQKIGIVDHTSLYKDVLKNTGQYNFIVLDDSNVNLKNTGSETDTTNRFDSYLIIDKPITKENNKITFISDKQISTDLRKYVENNFESYVYDQRLNESGVDSIKQIIANSKIPVEVSTIKKTAEGEDMQTSGEFASAIGIVITMVIYMFIFFYGAQVMNSVVEEKSNRIVEILISSVSPMDLMMGKILAVALVGLTQMMIWIVMIGGAMAYFSLSATMFGSADATAIANPDSSAEMINEIMGIMQSFDWGLIISMFILYFIGGYLIYSSLFAAVGAAVDNQADTQQFMLPITLPIVFGLYAAIYSVENPDGPLAFWCSLIPLTSPIVMMVRLPYDVPAWQIILSLAILYASFVGVVYIASRIYRVGILMYGKKTNYKDLLKWIRQ
ncbi:MAG: ABC transporter permease [Bacteroidales bacterium]